MDYSAKMFSQVPGSGEAALFGHRLYWQVTGLEQSLGQLDALIL